MDYYLYNGQLTTSTSVLLPLSNRGFQYGDGFFETLYYTEGQILFWEEHLDRIQEACTVLQFQFPEYLKLPLFLAQVKELAARNKCSEKARVKMKCWRSGAGLYTPQANQADWLLSLEPLPATTAAEPVKVEICQTIRTIPSIFSSFKGIQAPVYIMASLEKAKRKAEDVLLLSPRGFVAELTYANIFWVIGSTICTPSVATGCVHGVFKRRLKKWAKLNNFNFQEGEFLPEEFLKAEVVFAGNVMGLREINQVGNHMLPINPAFVQTLRETFW